ncbi:hypothetical protein EDB81DRAFT_943022 [Dactylonectria macrodidyma]|uniref:Uncharacterized protein n=1 Tax=Dactylonectria macrodidyma TaxID=307937 RepID=A0A9P9JFK1_9HYPO|nr:hypothetical protein EDB81DRAFT_943022 [Dactylonectria macrodidyma]
MNALRDLALGDFQNLEFRSCPLEYHITTAKSVQRLNGQLMEAAATLDEIERLTSTDLPFILVKVSYRTLSFKRHTFHTSQADCQRLQQIFRIDPCALGMITTKMMGFHLLRRDTSNRPASYYLKCVKYQLVWSYDQRSHQTRAIAFGNSSNPGNAVFRDLITTMKSNLDLVSHPLFLPLAGATQTITGMDAHMRGYYNECKQMENFTGLRIDSGGQMALHEFSEMSRQMNSLLVKVEKMLHKVRQWVLATESFKKHILHQESTCVQRPTIESIEDGNASVLEAVQLTQSKLEVMEATFNYIRARAQNQHNAASIIVEHGAIYELTWWQITQKITRDDALASIQLAKASTRDSSSMKVVAVMTMAFLPATFFAALFALPSLDWDNEPVVQDTFWVYWAFTLPCTALVFLLWAFLTQRQGLVYAFNWIARLPESTKLDK